jgi:8-oxo-dGTP pyrophosphatase MutT (NUDIX family)
VKPQRKIGIYMMNHYSIQWIEDWCLENGWTDLFVERRGNYWAFPPGGVMPEPIPINVLRLIKEENGFTDQEMYWAGAAIATTILAVIYTFWFKCPIPLVLSFGFNAVTVAQFEPEDF